MPIASRSLDYTEDSPSAVNPGFAATVTLTVPAVPNPYTKPFGSLQDRYPSKKAAKAAASKAALLHLIDLGQLAPDGSVIKKPKAPAAQVVNNSINAASDHPSIEGLKDSVDDSTSFASRVPALASKLGCGLPTYDITPTIPGVSGSSFYDCTASFPSIAGLPNPLATVRNVFGKKRAKEDCAREICTALEKIKEQRLRDAGQAGLKIEAKGARVESPTVHLGTGLPGVMDSVGGEKGEEGSEGKR